MEEKIMLNFIDAIIEKSGLKLEADFLADYREALLDELEKKIWLTVIKDLSDDQIKKFIEISEGMEDPEEMGDKKKIEIFGFFKDNVKNMEEKVLSAMDEFGERFIKDIKELK